MDLPSILGPRHARAAFDPLNFDGADQYLPNDAGVNREGQSRLFVTTVPKMMS